MRRSTSATRTSSRCWSWRRRCSRSPARARRSCTRRCRPMTRRSASPTARWRASCSAGSRRSISARGCGGRSRNPGSRPSSGWRVDARRPAGNSATCEKLARLGGRASHVANPQTPTDEPLAGPAERGLTEALPPVDIRRKRPPLLSFVLRAETLRRCARVLTLLGLDLVGLFGAILTALMIKAVLREHSWAWDKSWSETKGTIAFAYLVTVLLFARSGLYADRPVRPGLPRRAPPRCPPRAAGPAAHRLLALPGDGGDTDLRAGQRRAVLELLHLLR